MSYSVDPPQLIGLGERMRRSFDDLDEAARGLRRAADAAALGLVRALPAHGAFVELTAGRIDLAHRIVARGRAVLSALQTVVLAYLTADEEMAGAAEVAASRAAAVTNPFDPIVFGRRRL
ncbi:MAG: hypothetical protein IJO71_08470 [Microbacterium sp.]|jgi:uncharacterized protein YcaQ|uniref:hypothetical protein n=1 Tax=Microbacterium sp. TaxID=51671 RepID=UPI0025D276B9|nr:hypothetical protein [Microbacterium sp.]MBQ9917220.1 hypothetical protein [Microbacterium sp.]